MKIVIGLLLSTAFCCFGLSAATAQTEDEYKSVRDVLLNYSNGQSDLMNLAGNALRPLTHGRDYFEASDVGTYQKINDARRRSQLLVRVLSFDLDGNMEVTREEIEQAVTFQSGYSFQAPMQLKRMVDQQTNLLMQNDKNGDGKLSGNELTLPIANENPMNAEDITAGLGKALLAADPNKDDRITQTEILQILAHVSDGFSQAVPQHQSQAQAPRQDQCEHLAAPEGAKLLYLGAYEGTAVSSVTVAGQDAETDVATIAVDEGEKPITIVLTSYKPMIWQFTGKTDRVAAVFIVAPYGKATAGSGATGIGKQKIKFVQQSGCFHMEQNDDIAAARARGTMRATFGRDIEAILQTYALTTAEISSEGELLASKNKPKPQFPATKTAKSEPEWQNALRFKPAGVLTIDRARVVSNTEVEDYQVLPNQAGLAQLVDAGKLEMKDYVFRIVSKIRYPAELTGAHGVNFLLAKDIPAPDGDPGHSCVKSEVDGKVVDGHCR